MIIGVKSFSQGGEENEHKNLNVRFDYHKATLATSEKVMPVYTEVKYDFKKGERVNPFIKADYGYSYTDGMEGIGAVRDMTSNNYYNMGVGVEVNDLTMEMGYTNYQMGYTGNGTSENRVMMKVKYKY